MTTQAFDMRKAFATDQTGTSFTAKTPTATSPSGGAGVIELPRQGGHVDNLILVKPFGSDANNETFSFQVWRWTYNFTDALYEPLLVIECACILGNIARVAANYFDCDTITETNGDTETTRLVSHGTDKGSAYIVCDPIGALFVEFEISVSTAANANLLYQFIS